MPETARGLRSRHRLQVGVARQLEIKWLEPLGGCSSSEGASLPPLQRRAIRARNRSTRAPPSSSSGPRSAVRSRSSAASGAPASCLACAAASARRARRAGSSVSSEARSRNAAAAASPPRAGPGPPNARARRRPPRRGRSRLGAVPGAPIGIVVWIGRVRQRPVDLPPLRRRRRPIDRRAHQRMAEPHPGADVREPRTLPPAPAWLAIPSARRPATRALDRRPAPLPPPAAVSWVSFGRATRRRRKLSSIRPGRAAARPAARSRPPTAPGSAPAAAPGAPADYRGSRR